MELDLFNDTIGLPPRSHVSDDMIINSMPVFNITPGKPNYDKGLNLFRVIPDVKTYKEILSKHGFELKTDVVRLAFIADNFPTDSFVNDYGETFLQKFTDVASQGMGQLAQIAGTKSIDETALAYGEMLKNTGEEFGGTIGGIMSGAGSGMSSMGESFTKLASNENVNQIIGGGLKVVGNMMAGQRIDFPMVWRNSSHTPSYTATVRLYNPSPGSKLCTQKYIVGPLAAILCLSLPRTDNGNTYSWPFFHKIHSPGIYTLDPAVITNVTVIKGGDQQQIAFNQHMGMVDVRIDFVSLYNSILIEEKEDKLQNRPTLKKYLKVLGEEVKTTRTRKELNAINAKRTGDVTPDEQLVLNQLLYQNETNPPIQAVQKRKGTTITTNGESRVIAADKTKQSLLTAFSY